MKQTDEKYSLIITGVGGQGNVLASQLIGQALVENDYLVTIGETYGMAQRGGPVMSHVRYSKQRQPSPVIPEGQANLIMSLELAETLRVLITYGNEDVILLVNAHRVYPVDVTGGDAVYPDSRSLKDMLSTMAKKVYFLETTGKALDLGSSILTNMVMLGSLLELNILPVKDKQIDRIVTRRFRKDMAELNLQALTAGRLMVRNYSDV